MGTDLPGQCVSRDYHSLCYWNNKWPLPELDRSTLVPRLNSGDFLLHLLESKELSLVLFSPQFRKVLKLSRYVCKLRGFVLISPTLVYSSFRIFKSGGTFQGPWEIEKVPNVFWCLLGLFISPSFSSSVCTGLQIRLIQLLVALSFPSSSAALLSLLGFFSPLTPVQVWTSLPESSLPCFCPSIQFAHCRQCGLPFPKEETLILSLLWWLKTFSCIAPYSLWDGPEFLGQVYKSFCQHFLTHLCSSCQVPCGHSTCYLLGVHTLWHRPPIARVWDSLAPFFCEVLFILQVSDPVLPGSWRGSWWSQAVLNLLSWSALGTLHVFPNLILVLS